MSRRNSILLAGTAAGLTAAAGLAMTANAHHSWSVDYDTNQSITVSGTAGEFLRRRPHSAMLMEVQQPDGEIVEWTIEWGGGFRDENGQEFDPELFETGEAITVTGQPHRDE